MKVNYQVLLAKRDVNPTLDNWKGQMAKVWSYTVSHAVLEMRIIDERNPENYLRILCGDVEAIYGPVMWLNCHLEATETGSGMLLTDNKMSFKVHAGMIGVEEVFGG